MKVKAASLVLDFNLYPRHHLDGICIKDYANAMAAGAVFPPVVADKKSLRVVDGFKRVNAILKHLGEDAEIEVEWRAYRNEAALLFDAIVLNANHGERFSRYDMRRCALLGSQLGLDNDKLAAAMNVTVSHLEELRSLIHTMRDGSQAVGKQVTGHLAPGHLTRNQREGLERAGGGNQLFFVNQVVNLIEHDLLDYDNKPLMERMAHLGGLLRALLKKAA